MILLLSCSGLSPIHWSQVLSWEWRCSWSSADSQFSVDCIHSQDQQHPMRVIILKRWTEQWQFHAAVCPALSRLLHNGVLCKQTRDVPWDFSRYHWLFWVTPLAEEKVNKVMITSKKIMSNLGCAMGFLKISLIILSDTIGWRKSK